MSNVVDAAVYALRKKIDRPGGPSVIQTRRGMGYVFLPEGPEPAIAGEAAEVPGRVRARSPGAGEQ
jgi:hypothetical protein